MKKRKKLHKFYSHSLIPKIEKKVLTSRETIQSLIQLNIIPIINENDTVATDELKFGDNDRLAARVVQLINADLLILLSDVNGLYDQNPKLNKNANLIKNNNRNKFKNI